MDELSLVRLKIQELRKELLELEMQEKRLEQEKMDKEGRIVYSGNGTFTIFLTKEEQEHLNWEIQNTQKR